MLKQAISIATTYDVQLGWFRGSLAMIKLAASRKPQDLIKESNDLQYLLTKLEKVEETKVTALDWRDVAETWMSLIGLRSQMRSERAQIILDCVVSDKKLMEAIGASRTSSLAIVITRTALSDL